MKILIVQDYLRSGGTERQSIFLANGFAAAGHTVTLLTFRPGGALANTVATNVTRRSLQGFDWRLDWFAPGLVSAAAQIAPDVALCMGRMANCFALSLRDRGLVRNVVATMRTGKSLPWLFRRSLAGVRHIVANSRDARDTLVRDHRVAAERISVIHNALIFPAATSSAPNGGTAPSPRERLRAQHGATAATTVLLCVAMFRPEKNQRELVEIVEDLPGDLDWQLWLAGEGPARRACEELVTARQLASRVKFLGFQRDPSALYRAADFAVHASWSEALSNFLIEAQAHGLPAIAYEAQGIRECCIPGRTGWIIARDDRTAFRTTLMRRMTEAPESRLAAAASARAFARETFDPARQLAAYLQLFQRLTANRTAS